MPRPRTSLAAWSGPSVLLLAGLAACGAEATRSGPSIVLIVVDTLRKDHLSCYGHARETTPHVDRLAAEGVRFDLAYSQAPWTTPSIASLLTSRYPTSIGIRTERSVLSDDLVLLPEVLSDAGWSTGAVVSHTFCSSEWNFDQGFDHFDESNVLGHAAVTSEDVTARALEFVDQQTADAPFFLWAHYFDPHFAYVEHADHPFGGGDDYAGPIESGMQFSELFKMRGDLDEADVDEIRRLYDSEIAHTDRAIGALLDGLRARGIFDEALIVFTADHGEEFFDHGALGHARQMYQELVNVPLIVKFPQGSGLAGSVAEPVPLLDIFPTVLAVAGVGVPPGVEGRALVDEAGALRPQRRSFFSETARRGGVRAVVSGNWKLIEKAREGTYELYELAPDSRDSVDLARQNPERTAELTGLLDAWWRAQAAAAPEDLERELGEAQLQELRDLGYAGADEEDEDEPQGTDP